MIYRATITHEKWGKAHIIACKCGRDRAYPITDSKHVCPICLDTLNYPELMAQRARQPIRS